jgi:hypothetical protein
MSAKVSGSQRHVSMTCGTHNNRTDKFPPYCSNLFRPPELPDTRPVGTPRARKHVRARQPRVRISSCLYQEGDRDIHHNTLWTVKIKAQDFMCHGAIVTHTIKTHAPTREQAETNAVNVLVATTSCNVMSVSSLP